MQQEHNIRPCVKCCVQLDCKGQRRQQRCCKMMNVKTTMTTGLLLLLLQYGSHWSPAGPRAGPARHAPPRSVSCSAVRKKLVCTCHGQLAPKSQVLPTVTTNTGRRPTAAAVSHSVQIRRASLDAGSTAGREQATLLHLNYSETGICVIDVYKLHRVTDRQTDRQTDKLTLPLSRQKLLTRGRCENITK